MSDKFRTGFLTLLGILLFVAGLAVFGTWSVKRFQKSLDFDRQFTSLMMNSIHARTADAALVDLEKAIKFLRDNGMANGATSAMSYSKEHDLGLFMQQLELCEKILKDAKEGRLDQLSAQRTYHANICGQATQEVSKDASLTILPAGISVYPHNTFYLVWGWSGFLLLAAGVVLFVLGYFND